MSPIELSIEQKNVFQRIEQTNAHVFITGKAGTGKSVLLQYFRDHSKKRVAVVAPTGVAALTVRGQTIHSLFRFPPAFIEKESLSIDARTAAFLKHIDTVVIDEVSMVRVDLMDAIDHRLRQAHNNTVPFGGAQMVLFGDLYQLPPVVDEELQEYFEANYGGHFFFHADAWRRARLDLYELTEIFRQKDANFKMLLNALREGEITEQQLAQLNQRMVSDIPQKGIITLATTNAIVAEINHAKLAQLRGKAHEYQAKISGNLERSSFPTEEVLQLKKGAQVILLRNDKDKRWVNGTLGIIHSLTANEVKARVDGNVYSIPMETWEKIKYIYDRDTQSIREEVVSSFTQFPLRLAWAVTIHKSQGQTHATIAVDLTHATFAHGQLYVALSRCTSLEGVYLKTEIQQRHIIVDPKIRAFMQQVKKNSLE